MGKSKLKKTLPIIILVLIFAVFGLVLGNAYKASRGTQGWINGLRESLKYYDSETNTWRTGDGWQEQMNQFVRNQAALAKFQGSTITEVVEANIQYNFDTSKVLQRLFLK